MSSKTKHEDVLEKIAKAHRDGAGSSGKKSG